MNKLAESIEERIKGYCKEKPQIIEFFQNMILKGRLQAYSVDINRRIIEKDNDDEEIIRTIKGATLTPISIVPPAHRDNFFLEDVLATTMYSVELESRTSNSDFQPLTHMYGNCNITKLVKNPDLRKLGKYFSSVSIPKNMIDGNLHYSWDHDIKEGSHHEKRGYLTIEGNRFEEDNLFEKFYHFVKPQ